MMIIIVAVSIFKINYTEENNKYMAQKGILNLERWDIDKEKIIDLDGEWEFYSGRLIEPGQDFDKETKEYANVPGEWRSYLKDEGLENGSGTYRLKIKVPKDMTYAIKARTVRTSHRIYLNGEKIAQMGNPSTDKDKLISASRYKVGAGSSLNKEIELIVHVTSLNYRAGGILKSLEIGSFASIMEADNRNMALDALIVAICLTLGLYFAAIYLQRNKQPYLAYFSGVNLFMAVYLSTMDEQIITLILDYQPYIRTSIQMLSMNLTAVCFLRFAYHFFKGYSNRKLVNRIMILMLSVLSISLIILNVQGPNLLAIIQMANITCITIAYTYVLYILIKAIYKGSDSIEYILIIAASMISYWIILYTKVFLEIDLGNIPIFLVLIMMFSIAALMSDRLHLDYQEARTLSEKFERYDTLKDEYFKKKSAKSKKILLSMLTLMKNLLEGKEGVLNVLQQESLFKIYQQTEVLKREADNLLDISLIEDEKVKLTSGPIDIYKGVEDVLKEIEALIPYDKSIIIKNDIPKDFPQLKADSNKFRQIVHDLIDNAIKYTKHGQITISAEIIKGQAEIKVKDTGIGIEEIYLKEVFNIFYQKNDYETAEESLGVGLYIVKGLVEIQGGEINVKSVYGKGTTFRFTLPIYIEDKKDNKAESSNKFNTYKADQTSVKEEENRLEKILIVEAEPINQKLLNNIVERLGYKTIVVNTGKEALEIIDKEKIDLVILDFMISDMTINELCKQIRKQYSIGELPILILTASERAIDLMSSFSYGVNDFQGKPVDPEELKSRIQSLLLIKASAEEGLEKEFQYFYSQISPHFLYNTLNSIIGLSYNDTEKTRQALNNLSVYLRGKLDIHRKKGFVSLESELELVTAYLEIEELRYGDRLKVIYSIEEGLKGKIPPLTLQPIVENAVYHGISNISDGKIEISTKKEEDSFISITIEDNGKGMSPQEQEELLKGNGNGIGFKNVMERIKLLKGASLTLRSSLGEGTKVKIIIPEVKDNESNFD